MIKDFKFDPQMLGSLVGGLSVLDLKRLNIQNLDQAHDFINAYGFNIQKAADEKQLWAYYRRAVTYIRSELLAEEEEIPEVLSDPNQLKNIAYLLIYASTKDNKEHSLQTWSCAILKVIHVLVHLDNDIFSSFSTEIQDQVLDPIEKHIFTDPITGTWLGSPSEPDSISLKSFTTKQFKSSNSSITKLLAKPDAVAFTLLDKIGVRFTTKHLFDVFRVMRYLIRKNLVSFPHNISDQSNNTLFPLNVFLESIESLTRDAKYSGEELDELLMSKLSQAGDRAEYREKLNRFSGRNYSFIKFITRRLVDVSLEKSPEGKERSFNFFYPFEVQIVDYETHLKNLSGESSHEEYKKRQAQRARLRVLGKQIIKKQ